MSVTRYETRTDSVEIPLADVGCNVPPSVTVDVTIVAHDVLEIQRRDDVFILEGTPFAELTGVAGRDELPERVPDWIPAVAEWFGIREVELGR